MKLCPVSLREANRFVGLHHRHSEPVRGCLFCVGLEDGKERCTECHGTGENEVPIVESGWTICVDCEGTGEGHHVIAVAIVGRPVARELQDGFTAEVLRVCTTGTKNANSMLYGACWRAGAAMGYTRMVTYTLDEEGGASLRAAGWTAAEALPPRPGWDMPGRPRSSSYVSSGRWRWERGERAGRQRAAVPESQTGQESLL